MSRLSLGEHVGHVRTDQHPTSAGSCLQAQNGTARHGTAHHGVDGMARHGTGQGDVVCYNMSNVTSTECSHGNQPHWQTSSSMCLSTVHPCQLVHLRQSTPHTLPMYVGLTSFGEWLASALLACASFQKPTANTLPSAQDNLPGGCIPASWPTSHQLAS
mgnify:CR=1 FL=1